MAFSGLNLPTIDGLSSTAGSELNAIQDFSTASFSKLKAEAVQCLKDTGQLVSFKTITPDVKVVQVGDNLGITTSTTSALVSQANFVPVLSNPQGGVPATYENWKDRTEEFKVTITQSIPVGGVQPRVVFTVMPTIDESHTAQYDSFSPLHHPGQILKYRSTDSRTWSISAKLISRTPEEASENLDAINLIRSWVMPYYGIGTESTNPDLLGAPPPILTLSAYGDQMIGPVKCVLKSYSLGFPNDVDYIQTLSTPDIPAVPFPVIQSVSIQLEESWSPAEYSGFSITAYRSGDMQNAFMAVQAQQPATQTPDAVGVNTNEPTIVGRRAAASIAEYQQYASNATMTAQKTVSAVGTNGLHGVKANLGMSPGGGHKSGAGGI
jgi:hypothetical protein